MSRPPSKPKQNNFFFKPLAKPALVQDVDRLFQHGFALFNQGRFAQAVDVFEKVIELNPRHFDACYLLGTLAGQSSQWQTALIYFRKALAINDSLAAAHNNCGIVLKNLELFEEALESYDKAISLEHHFIAAFYNRGIVLNELHRYEEAIESFQTALKLKPDYSEAYNNCGLALKQLHKFEEACDHYKKAIELDSKNYEAFNNLGIALYELKQYEAALKTYSKAIQLKNDYAEVYSNRGLALVELKQFDEALQSYDQSITLKTDYAEAYSNRGIVLTKINRFDEALQSYNKAIQLKNDYAEAYSNRGIALTEFKLFDEALQSYDKAIKLEPDYAPAYFNKSLLLLLFKDYESGWHLYEWRWKVSQKDFYRHFIQPLWLGADSLTNKTILLHAEQGLGDTIQFCRYVASVKKLGARVLLELPKSLISLLENLDGVDQVIEIGKQLPDFDYHCPLLSLPYAFKTELNTIPSPRPYLKSDADKVKIWDQRLGEKSKPRIGLVWNGNALHINDHNRSQELTDLIQYLPRDFEYVSLQKEVRDCDKQTLASSEIKHYEDQLSDFTETAALCELMDIVISVDTSVAHLAAALGKPTWISIPFIPDWRWLLDIDSSPWYESVKLYRQEEDRQWATVLKRVARDLTEFFK